MSQVLTRLLRNTFGVWVFWLILFRSAVRHRVPLLNGDAAAHLWVQRRDVCPQTVRCEYVALLPLVAFQSQTAAFFGGLSKFVYLL